MMGPLLPVLIGAGALALILAARRAGAAPREPSQPNPSRVPPEGGGSAGAGVERWRPLALTFGSPFPAGALLAVMKTESGGNPAAVAADQVMGASELGLTQLVVEHDADANPNLASRAGAIGADVDPLHPAGAIWGAQWVYAQAKDRFTGDLREHGLNVPPDTDVPAWIVLMHGQHSIGRAGVKKLMGAIQARGGREYVAGLREWVASGRPFPSINRQSSLLVAKRVRRMLALPEKAARLAPLPGFIGPLSPRGEAVPPFDAARAKAAIIAKRGRR